MPRILIVEDDTLVGRWMAAHLREAGLEPILLTSGATALERLCDEHPDACVLDLMLPGIDGQTLIDRARRRGCRTPIIVVSARGGERDRIEALELGADDYLVKPVSIDELIARIRAALRRARELPPADGDETIEIGRLRVEPRHFQAYLDGVSAGLTPTEFRVLHALALARGRVLSRDELLQRIWGREQAPRDRTVDVCIKRLRDKIDRRSTEQTFIQTRFGVGYMLEPLECEPAAAR
ncbi:MAG: response regulator transcription factor [Gaiellaceae bacterium]